MKLPFFNRGARKEPAAMTEAELEKGIARSEKILAKRPKIAGFVSVGSLFVTSGSYVLQVLLAGAAVTNAMAPLALAAGVAFFFGCGYTCKAVMTHALRRRNALTDVLETKVAARLAADEAAALEWQKNAAERFNASVEAGLPLEQKISVGKPLRLKFPAMEEPKNGFARAVFRMFGPSP